MQNKIQMLTFGKSFKFLQLVHTFLIMIKFKISLIINCYFMHIFLITENKTLAIHKMFKWNYLKIFNNYCNQNYGQTCTKFSSI